MGLIVPQPPSFGYYANNAPTTVPTGTSGVGTAMTAGASNAKGTAVSLLTITQDVHFLRVGFGNFFANATNCSVLADILVDPAGGTSWQVRIPNLFAGNTMLPDLDISGSANAIRWFEFPIFIPAGAAIGCQGATAHTVAQAGEVILQVAGGDASGVFPSGQGVEAIGVNTADSGGTAHTAGNTSAFSSWTNFGSTLVNPAKGIIFSLQGEGDSSFTSLAYIFEFGVAGQIIGAPILVGTTTTETSNLILQQSFNNVSLPAGTQLQVRGKCSGTAQPIDVAAWALS